jgi:copper(I)-binding protein
MKIRPTRRLLLRTLLLPLAAAAISGTAAAPVEVEDVRLVLGASRKLGTLQLSIRNNAAAHDSLVEASVAGAARTVLHTPDAGGMRHADAINVQAGAKTVLADQGSHVMVEQIGPDLRPGGTTTARLRFARGGTVNVQARIVEAPSAGHHH